MPKSKKGGEFERQICSQLSEWWLGHDQDCVFWRTDSSGGRATRRKQKGLKTTGKCGDVSSTHPCSAVFSKLITVELKRGYKTSVADLLDRPRTMRNKTNQTPFEEFIEQTIQASENANTPYWMLIHRRDSKESMVYMQESLYEGLTYYAKRYDVPTPMMRLKARVQLKKRCVLNIVGMRFDSFLSTFEPAQVRKLWKHLKSINMT